MTTPDRDALLAMPVRAVPFVLFDLETTGLDPDVDRVCEVAMLRWQHGEAIDSFEALVNPGRPLEPGAYAVNHITTAMLEHAPTFGELAPPLLRTIGNGVLVAHNAAFDVCFLDAELVRAGYQPLKNVVIDTLALARSFLNHERYNLDALAQRIGASQPAHRAMSDVQALVGVFDHLVTHLEMLGVETLEDLQRAQRGLLPGEMEPAADPLILEAMRHGRRLRISYRTKGGDPIPRDVLPVELRTTNGLPRLVAYCFLRNAQRTFYLDRIAEIRWSDEE